MKLRITLKLWKDDGTTCTYCSSKTKRIVAKVKAEKFQKAYLRVYYGKAKTAMGKSEDIDNSGDYISPEEVLSTLSAFTEPALLEDTQKWIYAT